MNATQQLHDLGQSLWLDNITRTLLSSGTLARYIKDFAVHRNIVVAQVDGDFTVKYLHRRNGRVKLVPANPTFPEITFKDGQTLTICGVVTCSIKRFVT